ncbi:MAG: hypothetical protein ABIQ35_11035 [Verrucomicrobiota bacterium]
MASRRKKLSIVLIAAGIFLVTIVWQINRQPQGRFRIPTGNVIPTISFGWSHGLILASDGSLWTWGENGLGWPTLGLGKISEQPVLCRIDNATNWIGASAGHDHNLAVKSDGSLWAWGANYRQQLGDGTKTKRAIPVRSCAGNDWRQGIAGNVCSFALKTNGTLWAWGLNNFCQLGNGSFKDAPTAVQIGTATNWIKIVAGGVNTAGIQSDGSLWVWGANLSVGNTTPLNTNNLLIPTLLSNETNWVDAVVDYNIGFSVKSDGTLWAWGTDAKIFIKTNYDPTIPTRVGSDNDWQACTGGGCGRHYFLFTKKDRSIWEADGSGTLGKVPLSKTLVALGGGRGKIGAALTGDGAVWTWGRIFGVHQSLDRATVFLSKFSPRFTPYFENYENKETPWLLRNVDSPR